MPFRAVSPKSSLDPFPVAGKLGGIDTSRAPQPTAFVSYSHDSDEHKAHVLEFCTRLREQGVDVTLDQWDDDGRRDWSLWALENMEHEYVIVIASPAYKRRAEGKAPPDEGRGAQWEGAILRDRLTENRPYWTRRILPVVLPGGSVGDIPAFLTPYSTTRYLLSDLTPGGLAYLLSSMYGLGLPKPPLGRFDGPHALPRIVAADRESLRPRTLQPVDRSKLLNDARSVRTTRSAVDGREQALALTGAGGIGKSILLGQLLDRFEAEPAEGAAVLVVATSVQPGALNGDIAEVDRALGMAADRALGQGGLIALLRVLRAAHGKATLVLDTLDLLVEPATLTGLAAILAEALEIGEVVFTCRTHEFEHYLRDTERSAPRLAGRLTEFVLPLLEPAEIVDWARRFLAGQDGDDDHAAFLQSLQGGVAEDGPLRHVCALPVRLALTCRTFGALGRVPEDLTVTGLYQAYWNTRVREHAGIAGSPEGDRKEQAALRVAAKVVTDEGAVRLRVPKGLLEDADLRGLRLLDSEGVLRDRDTSWEFFHQTFAEYAHGRWLLLRGADSAEVATLMARLTTRGSPLWPVARTLLLQAGSAEEHQELDALLPSGLAEAAVVRVLAALQRDEPEAVRGVLDGVVDQPALLRETLPVLVDVPPRHRPVVFGHALQVLRQYPKTLGDPAIRALVPLVSRTNPVEWFSDAVAAVFQVKGELGDAATDGAHERLVLRLATGPMPAEIHRLLQERYRAFGPLGRRASLYGYAVAPAPEDEVSKIAEVALRTARPPLPDDDLVAFMLALWRSEKVRAARGWTGWRDMLAEPLPAEWNNGQIKLAVRLALDEPPIADEVVDDALGGSIRSPEPQISVLEQFAAERPAWTARRLLAAELPQNRVAVNAIGRCAAVLATGVDAATRSRLGSWLAPAKNLVPRTIWPALAVLAADDESRHRTLLAEAAAEDLLPAVREGLTSAWIGGTPRPLLDRLARDLRAVISAQDTDTMDQLRARLEGRLADSDETARKWIADCLLTGRSPAVAGTAVKTIVTTITTFPAEFVAWLGPLLDTPHTDAATRLAEFLSQPELPALPADLPARCLHRLQTAAGNGEAATLQRALLTLLIRLDDAMALPAETVLAVHTVVRGRLPLDRREPATHDHSAAFRDLVTLSGTLMARRLSGEQTRSLLTDVLSTLDPARLGKKLPTAMRALIRSLAGRDPRALPWLEEIFGLPDTSTAVRQAIAETFLLLDGTAADGRAARLAGHPECPAEVATFISARIAS